MLRRVAAAYGSPAWGLVMAEWETVPMGTAPSVCTGSSCRARIFMIERLSKASQRAADMPDLFPMSKPAPKTVRVPVDCSVPGGREPTPTTDGRGLNHYTTCSNADEF
jgi:hypothetical protein